MLTKEQVNLLNTMCLGAYEVELGTLLQQLQLKEEKEKNIVWYNFDRTPTEEIMN